MIMAAKRRRIGLTITIVLLAVLLAAAYITKPDDKKCIIAAVESVWGPLTPDKFKRAQYYEQFMDINSKSVAVDDWIFVKRIRYQFGEEYKVVGYGAFANVFLLYKSNKRPLK